MADKIGSDRFEMIVGLHDVADPPVAEGDELLSWMAFSEAERLLERILDNTRLRGTRLRVTSDDAFCSDYEVLFPWLVERGVAGTFFIPTRFLDRPGRLSGARVREMLAGGMQIGAHGARHLDWTKIPESEFVADIDEGRDRLEQVIGARVSRVAAPFGGYNARILKHLRERGFDEIHTCRPGLAYVREPLKPRNMLKASQVAAVLAVSDRRGDLADLFRCRLRRLSCRFLERPSAGP